MTLLSVLLFGCGDGWQARCTKVQNQICTLRVQCGIENSFADCQENLAEDYICDDTVPPQAFDPCVFRLEEYLDAEPPVCYDALPIECGDVLCSKAFGCDFETVRETGNELPLETGQTSGSSGSTGDTAGGDTGRGT